VRLSYISWRSPNAVLKVILNVEVVNKEEDEELQFTGQLFGGLR
jgi:hypothetical protein